MTLGTAKQKWEMEPRAVTKDKRKKAVVKQRRDSYIAIEHRDAMLCRCCGKKVVRTLELRLDRLEHHHVNGRDVPDAEGTWNLACVCKECHDERHLKRTLRIAGDADGFLRMKQGDKAWLSKPVRPFTKAVSR